MVESLVTEPMTTATDYALAAVTSIWGARLWHQRGNAARRWWAVAFFALAGAALLGGTVHGFRTALGPALERLLWWGSLVAAGTFGFAALMTAAAFVRPTVARGASVVATIAMIAYAIFVWRNPVFAYAALASMIGGIAMVVAQGRAWALSRSASAPWILSGAAVSVLGITIQRAGWGLGPGFNHNDAFHVVQMSGNYLLYRGGRLLDSPAGS